MSYRDAERLKPKEIKPHNFPLGYTKADEERHQQVMRRLHYTSVIAKMLFVGAGLFAVYVIATIKPVTTEYTQLSSDTPLQTQEQKHE